MFRKSSRRISEKFIADLKVGSLNSVLEAVLRDDMLCLEIRDQYINIYYRGGNLLKIEEKSSGYVPTFHKRYYEHKTCESKYKQMIIKARNVGDYVSLIPYLKEEMNLYLYEHPKLERELQQHILRENNCTTLARDTDYYIADIEYANMSNGSRFDMLAVKWPSTSISRKNGKGLGLAFIEVKFGDNALTGSAGLEKHFKDMESFLRNHSVSDICAEAQNMLNQKIELGLVSGLSESSRISINLEQRMAFILLLANHKPASSVLKRELKSISQTEIYKNLSGMIDVKIAGSSLMGYGLYERAMVSLEEYIHGD